MANDDDDLRRAAEGRIFFSHHSVGGNLLDGVAALAAAATARAPSPPAVPRLIPLAEAERTPGPGWVHGSGGQNGQPLGKLAFFAEAMAETGRGGPGLGADLAFMKFCYVDFTPHTDVDELFGAYQKTLDDLRARHPRTTFGHVTVPLTRRPRDIKARAQRLLGRSVWEDAANARRLAFNQRLLQHFAGQPIFDLARHESTRPDGSRESFTADGGLAYALAPVYTDDGGHLNGVGRRVMAQHLIRFVADALPDKG